MKILVTFKATEGQKAFLEQFFARETQVVFLKDYPEEKQDSLIGDADVLLSWNPGNERISGHTLTPEKDRFIQLLSAGYDHLDLSEFSEKVKIAANQGAYAGPMAEHVVAMILALMKKLPVYHGQLSRGIFNQQQSFTKTVSGTALGIIGFGSIGKATARLMKPFGVRILALNTTGKTDEEVAFAGTLNDIDHVLCNSDILLLSCPLNQETNGLINRGKLERMKNDAILINVARGPIINEQDLYEHLKSHPDFYAGIDAWWVEPFKYKKFVINYPFFELPNLLGSPHNSAMAGDAMLMGLEKAAENVKRYLRHEKIAGLIRLTPADAHVPDNLYSF